MKKEEKKYKENIKYVVSSLRNRFWPCVLAQILKMSKKEKREKIVYVHSIIHVLSLGLCGEKKVSHETRNIECLFPENEKNFTVQQFEKY